MEIQHINTDLLTRGRLETMIIRMESPLLFWVQLKNGEENLKELEEELNFRMSRKADYLYIWPDQMRIDIDIAVRDRQSWRRGFVKRFNRTTSMVLVSLEDWGRLLWRRMNDVYLLEERFQQLPWQGIICSLVYTGPVTDTSTWPKETNDLCQLLLEGQRG